MSQKPWIEKLPNSENVRVRWIGISGIKTARGGVQFVDIDPCPYRNLTALESATVFCRSVLGQEPEVI